MIKQLIIQKLDVIYFAVFKSLLTILSIFLDVNTKRNTKRGQIYFKKVRKRAKKGTDLF